MAYTTIDKPTDYFNTITYTGDDVDGRTITGVGFQSDWTWVKARSSAFSHYIIDAIRYDSGASKYLKLDSSSTAADATPSGAGWISALNSDGYVCKNGTSNTNNCNENGVTYVAWNWLGANGTASNTDGSITSTVSANTTSGFSIVSYTGNGTSGTIGHGLGSVPQMLIVKNRTDSAHEWKVYHHTLGNNKRLHLNDTSAVATTTASWNATTPTSSVFSVGADGGTNDSGDSMIAYCFAEKKGFSKFGSYTGNGSTDGTFVYTGFKPAWLMVKRTDSTNNWLMYDNKRSAFNVTDDYLLADASDAEVTNNSGQALDLLSNGFKIKNSNLASNASGGTYIYMCFAESPFTTSTGIPTTAR